jgi:hypothetical protein
VVGRLLPSLRSTMTTRSLRGPRTPYRVTCLDGFLRVEGEEALGKSILEFDKMLKEGPVYSATRWKGQHAPWTEVDAGNGRRSGPAR